MNTLSIAVNTLGYKGYRCLLALIKNGFHKNVKIHIIVGEDSQVTDDYASQSLELCVQNGISVEKRNSAISYSQYSYIFAIGWRWMIRDVENDKLIVFHDSLLPSYRGFAPLVNAAMNKEPKIGVTVLFGHDDYDRGEIINQQAIDVRYPIRISSLIENISYCYEKLFEDVVSQIISGKGLFSRKQVEGEASYSIWLDNQDYLIDWGCDAKDIAHKINLLGAPYQHAKTTVKDKSVTIVSAEVYEDLKVTNRHVGKVLLIDSGCPVVVCGKGLLKINSMYDEDNNSLIPYPFIRVRFR
ncbi:formyltransferase family protein [Pseudoalteromonas sp. Of11M-6]|uniref:formyltransferase family protein n=1 Tax=Pseudoalteromonas sp. Of11M-6 TaxID=2917754 RepID=UPI001EF671E3|nr:formyltransferase family protein [Pseudoalteromonas sp. Of11M-6]MCG7555752.1 hypothetical protein [Pseudoalteromonas sp. Of11M-6]